MSEIMVERSPGIHDKERGQLFESELQSQINQRGKRRRAPVYYSRMEWW
jgi:hypothetical protein